MAAQTIRPKKNAPEGAFRWSGERALLYQREDTTRTMSRHLLE